MEGLKMPQVQIKVLYFDDSEETFPVYEVWKIDAPTGVLIVGKGFGRKHIPLSNIRWFEVEELK